VCRSYHLVNAHEVKPVRLIQSLCAVCGSNLAGLTLLYIVLPWMAAVVCRPAWRMLVLLIARYVSNLINKHYYYYIPYWTPDLHAEKLSETGPWCISWATRCGLHAEPGMKLLVSCVSIGFGAIGSHSTKSFRSLPSTYTISCWGKQTLNIASSHTVCINCIKL